MRVISAGIILALGLLFPGQAAAQVRSGAEVLLSDSLHLLIGKRIGLLANHTSRLSNGVLLFDTLLTQKEITLAAVFSPEHGFRGTAADGEAVASGVVAGVPLHSLFGATRRPTPEMFAGLDVLVMDLQDVGARYYTYLSTMAMCLETAAAAGLPVIVCDRPNPVGGEIVEGPIRDDSLRSFVGYLPLPVRHGLTAGEAVRMMVGEGWLRGAVRPMVTVVPCAGWSRAMYYDETGLPWVRPSPNIISLDAAISYTGMCLLEGTNISEGRGTDAPFLMFGAPFIDADSLSAALNARGLPGVRFHPAAFTPKPGTGAPHPKYNGQECAGARIEITDRALFDSFGCGVAILSVLRIHYGAFFTCTSYLDQLAGVPRFNELSVPAVSRRSADDVRRFTAERLPYLLYN
ncbi:MAG: DUF1343 domain-containing protein [Bacteroidota bacterium]